MIDQLK